MSPTTPSTKTSTFVLDCRNSLSYVLVFVLELVLVWRPAYSMPYYLDQLVNIQK